MEQDDDKNIPSDNPDKPIDDSSAVIEDKNNADTAEEDKDDQNKDESNSEDKDTIQSAPDSSTTKIVEDSSTINTETLDAADEKIPEDELQDTGPPEPPSEEKEDPKSNQDSNILPETSELNNLETQPTNPESHSPDPQDETMEAEKQDSVSIDLPIENMDVENQDSGSLDPQNENTELENIDSSSLDPQNTNTETKSQDPNSSEHENVDSSSLDPKNTNTETKSQDPDTSELENIDSSSLDPQNTNTETKSQDPDSLEVHNEDSESIAKTSSTQEESEEGITSEKPIVDSETPDPDDKPDEIVAAETPRLKILSLVEDSVSESRTEKPEDLEEPREKIDGDFEDSSSSIAEYQKYQGLNNAEEKAEGDETTKKGDSGGSDSNFESNQEKNALVVEPENTEFVQISQEDKHDESQNENQSIDNAEDPFGGDNLNSENLDENMETDNLSEEIPDFQKLGDQADNLQDVVKAKDNFQGDKPKDDDVEKSSDISSDIMEKPSEIAEIDSAEPAIDNSKETGEKEAPRESGNEKEQTNDQNVEKTDKEGEKILLKDGIPPLDTDHVPSDVLPGQDDELCIIPDSMKVILPGETVEKEKELAKKVGEEDKAVAEKTTTPKSVADLQKTRAKDVEGVSVLKETAKQKESVQQTAAKKGEGKAKAVKSTSSSSSSADLVINIDDESKNSEIEEIETKEKCKQCGEEKSCKIKVKIGLDCFNVCSKECRNTFKTANNKATDIPSDGVNSKREKRCAGCLLIVEAGDERNLSWETMEFCNEECLGKFQTKYGSYCRNCNGSVQAVSLGKYCVRFGYDVRQFCCSTCLEEFKKGLKVCSYCQKDISSGIEGFLAPVGDKGQFKDFCTQDCMEKYSRMSSSEPPASEKKSCSVCQEEKIVHCEVQINGGGPVAICSDPCFAAFKFVNKVDPDQCSTCKKFFQLLSKKNFVVFYEGEAHMFCNKTCLNVFIITNRKIVPCNWCKVKKYNFDMIKKELKTGQVMMMCSLNCLTLYQVSINAVSARRINCDFCKEYSQAQYHLTMSDATIRNFCSYKCVMNFQSQYTKSPITIPSSDDPVPTGIPKRSITQQRVASQAAQKQSDVQGKNLPVISSVTSLAAIGNGQNCSPAAQQNSVNNLSGSITVQGQPQPPPQIIYKQQIIARPPSPVKVHNKMTQCKPLTHTKGVSVRPHPCTKSTQTDENQQIVIPIPVPIYVPYPMHMYSMPFPVPFPFPLPIPVPIFIPTTRNSAKGIFKDIKRIQEKIPADPFEAELLMMAEMVATEKKPESDSDSEDDNRDDVADVPANSTSDGFSPEGVDSSNTFGDDMLQMALKMATGELDEPAVDLEAALTPNTITATQAPPQQDSAIDGDAQPERLISTRGRKRMVPYKPRSTPSKRGRRVTGSNEIPLMPPPEPQPPPQPRIMEPTEKPDANMALKYTFGVNAWRQWVVGKNSELEKQSTPTRRVKLFKTELLQLTADELNYSLCLFVKEVRKPNGAEYAPDTIYYLCLGIQQYLFENNRIDNIFTDSYYEKFTDCLNDVAKKFSVLYNDAQYIVTRVEEEHLWESKQLGAHSPHVLLSTLMFFNTKHFNLVTVEEHMQLSFSHIMKHWKRNPAAQPAAVAGKVPGSRNVLLRFYPPQSALEANSRKKKVYEQQENEDNPLRCPVKLYEFYLSKCPESVKTRNDVFYLLPERSCVPDSPVWYSTSPLAKEHLIKMLYRVKMVKEINVALLTS